MMTTALNPARWMNAVTTSHVEKTGSSTLFAASGYTAGRCHHDLSMWMSCLCEAVFSTYLKLGGVIVPRLDQGGEAELHVDDSLLDGS